ncbi:4,5-DOPA dioxygenase extradiol [Cohaesibacter sp. CAU 1516]|uniref:4,5-DOPA-extradiol-dioxygenase n=1 Tax=Cohaesibacter sp. CAU 1516 TaxID=2576038 RepID=UPI0010FD9F53|nr:4,5-DOPA dioxygenase extradiol [Cohaesibacter sp. CAU 1516]TLP45029.1 4,5-DOPA dioxygenase extradiol [Cohaesibacter sp. CAU 1516]
MSASYALEKLKDRLTLSERMPVVFLGHGSPMNAIEDTPYSRSWTDLGKSLPQPQAILVVSAHWMTRGHTLVDISAMPKTIHDFYGFPRQLYNETYPAKGDPELAREVVSLLASHHAQEDDRWGLDHGAWTVLKFLFPNADVPVFQLSIDLAMPFEEHLEVGKTLASLRDRGVLILGSGNIVHNLHALRMDGKAHDFALAFDAHFEQRLTARDMGALADRKAMGNLFKLAHPSSDHYIPALTIAGAASEQDTLTYLTEDLAMGAVSMRSFIFHGG